MPGTPATSAARYGSTRMSPRRPSLLLALALLMLPVPWACGSSPEVQPCGEIPEGGCPIGRGGSCDDAACAALHDCLEGEWTEVETCPGTGTVAASSGAGGSGAGGCEPVVIDRTGETDGCTPDHQEPDCPAVAAEVCPDPCATGCVDFFLCVEEGWIDVATCDESGQLRLTR
jgi:hypothetical protein